MQPTQPKHRLTDATRRLLEAVALLDPDKTDAAALDDLSGRVEAVADAVGSRPMLPDLTGPPLEERSGFSGRSNPLAAPMTVVRDGELTRATAVYGAAYEGPPATLHGGFVAGAFDDLLGTAQMVSGQGGFTGVLTVKMRRPTPLRTRIDYEAGVSRIEGRKIVAWGKSYAAGALTAEAECLFVIPRERYLSS